MVVRSDSVSFMVAMVILFLRSGRGVCGPVNDSPNLPLKQRRKGVAHHVTDLVGDEGDFLEPELIQNGGEVPSLRHLFVTALGMGRQAHAS